MEFKELFNMQAQLDSFIQKNQQINRDVFLEKGLALTIDQGTPRPSRGSP